MKRVEIPALGHSTISGSLRAYQTCGEWLKKVIKVDLDVTGISVLQSPCWKELKENIRIWSRRLKIGKAHLLPSTVIKALIKVWADLRMPHNTGQHILYPLLNKGAEQWDPALYYQCPLLKPSSDSTLWVRFFTRALLRVPQAIVLKQVFKYAFKP